MNKKRVALLDDHLLFRAGVRMLLQASQGYEVVAEASTASQALAEFPQLPIDLVLIDISLPDMSGIELIRSLPSAPWQGPIPKMAVLSMHGQREFVVRAFEAGAMGYFLKESAPEQLEAGLDRVGNNEYWVSEQLGDFHEYLGSKDVTPPLTARQTEVLRLLASGHNVKSIAHHLDISPKTVQTFRSQIMARLKLKDFAALMRFAIRNGIVPD